MSINPYEAPQSGGEGAVETGMPLVLAGRGQRLAAKLMFWFVSWLLVLPSSKLSTGSWWFRPTFGDFDIWVREFAVYYGIYLLLMLGLGGINLYLLHRSGQTIFKRLLKIRIVRSDGSEASLNRLVWVRWLPFYLCMILPCLNIVFFLCDALCIYRDDQRCLHDLLADTAVVDATAHPPPHLAVAA